MQIAVIEYTRSILGHPDATSEEFNPNTKMPCVVHMPEVGLFANPNCTCMYICLVGLLHWEFSFRPQKLTWEEPCVLVQEGHISMLKIASLLSCMYHHATDYCIMCKIIYFPCLFIPKLWLFFCICLSFLRYGNVDYVEERHRHRYEVCHAHMFFHAASSSIGISHMHLIACRWILIWWMNLKLLAFPLLVEMRPEIAWRSESVTGSYLYFFVVVVSYIHFSMWICRFLNCQIILITLVHSFTLSLNQGPESLLLFL